MLEDFDAPVRSSSKAPDRAVFRCAAYGIQLEDLEYYFSEIRTEEAMMDNLKMKVNRKVGLLESFTPEAFCKAISTVPMTNLSVDSFLLST